MTLPTGRADAGLYVHVPFCLTRCGYCDFNAYAGRGHLAEAYADALAAEAALVSAAWSGVSFVSLFLGGGTPTSLPAPRLVGLLDQLRHRFALTEDAEVTVEANPDTVDAAYLSVLRHGGVGRLSLGLQSFDPAALAALERVHTAESAERAFRAARRAGFADVNLDLIYGADGESLASWEATLCRAVALDPDHLSCYALTIEAGTPLGRKVAAGAIPHPDPDLQADMFESACRILSEAGLVHYEVSNWAKPGHGCRHNRGYWEGRPYLGLGAGAHSARDGRRWWNVRPPQQYLDHVRAGRVPVGGQERLGPDDVRLERLLLGLRVAEGVPAGGLDRARLAGVVAEGLATEREGRVALTERGMLLANEVVLALAE